MPGDQNPGAVSALQNSGLAQSQHGAPLIGTLSDIPDIVQFHREPGGLATGPDCQFDDRDLQPCHHLKLRLQVPGEVVPAHVFSSLDRIADDIHVVGDQPRESGKIFLGIGLHQGTEHGFRAVRVSGNSSWFEKGEKENHPGPDTETVHQAHAEVPCRVGIISSV